MSRESQADREVEILQEQLNNGEISIKEYNRLIGNIEREMRERGGE